MKKELEFCELLPYSLKKVWAVLQQPADVVCEPNVKVEKLSDTQWVEHCSDGASNNSTAHIDEEQHKVVVETVNSKYTTETNVIELVLKETGDQCELHVDYTVGTGAIFNIITMKVLGDKLLHHASKVILKNIRKKLT